MDCYSCKHRTNVCGSAHSACNAIGTHPIFSDMTERQKSLLRFHSGMHKGQILESVGLIHIDEYGFKSGWATWPINFDHTWISDCKLIEPKSDITFERIENGKETSQTKNILEPDI